jgi:ribosomal protein L3 glutamine methyltransferase
MPERPDHEALASLLTVRDWLRWAVSRFNAAGIAYGHGTTNALDEAAFLILKTLHLPIDQLEPWLEARLVQSERIAVVDVIERRIATRKPAAYLINEAWIGGHAFYVDERVIVPRSLLGELLDKGLSPLVPDPADVSRVLDLCTGSGCLAILAALTFPRARIDATDISGDALAVAARNVASHALDERISLLAGDLFAPVKNQRYDLILANPPYVPENTVASFPPEHRAEPALAHAGGPDGLDLVRRILKGAPDHLAPSGHIVVEVGASRPLLEAEYPRLPFVWLDTEESQGEVFWLKAADLAPLRRPRRSLTDVPTCCAAALIGLEQDRFGLNHFTCIRDAPAEA